MTTAGRLQFATFWQGELSPLEIACISSAQGVGGEVTVYSYSTLEGLPNGAKTSDAREIVPEASVNRFIHAGKPNLSHFTDFFRYNLFAKTNAIWIDTDMFLLDWPRQELPGTLLARERAPSICGAIMRIDRNEPELDVLLQQSAKKMDKELLWGETGPLLLTKVFGRESLLQRALPAKAFYELDYPEFWKAFLPEFAEECILRTDRSLGVHLWNNIVDTLGYWKWIAPPKGSFLDIILGERNLLDGFKATYPAKIMNNMVENFLLRKSGADLGIKGVASQLVPSLGRTLQHYVKSGSGSR